MVEGAATHLRLQNKIANDRPLQDYVVVSGQLWLDGIAGADGNVCQFVAMPFGSGHAIEAQVTGRDDCGGLQFEVTTYEYTPPKPPTPIPLMARSGHKIVVKLLLGRRSSCGLIWKKRSKH